MGTNTLATTYTGSIVLASDVNQFRTALTGEIVPRNSDGAATANGGTLGTSTYPFSSVFAQAINAGTTGAGEGQIKTSGAYLSTGGISIYQSYSDALERLNIGNVGGNYGLQLGDGTIFDTTLYRPSPHVLQTDDAFVVGGALGLLGNTVSSSVGAANSKVAITINSVNYYLLAVTA